MQKIARLNEQFKLIRSILWPLLSDKKNIIHKFWKIKLPLFHNLKINHWVSASLDIFIVQKLCTNGVSTNYCHFKIPRFIAGFLFSWHFLIIVVPWLLLYIYQHQIRVLLGCRLFYYNNCYFEIWVKNTLLFYQGRLDNIYSLFKWLKSTQMYWHSSKECNYYFWKSAV